LCQAHFCEKNIVKHLKHGLLQMHKKMLQSFLPQNKEKNVFTIIVLNHGEIYFYNA